MARLVQEVEDIRLLVETMKRLVAGLGLEEKGGQTGGSSGTTGRGEG